MNETQLKLMAEEPEKIERGLYVYCIANGNGSVSLGKIGIEQSEVYTINCKDMCAIVHECPALPYNSENPEIAKNWIKIHNEVITKAGERFGTVLPMTFDMIIKGNTNTAPNDNVFKWLKENYDNFKERLTEFEGKHEFGIQIFWDKDIFNGNIAAENIEVVKLKKELEKTSKGKAYFIEQKIKNLLNTELEWQADRYFKTFYEQIKKHAVDIKVEKVKEKEMLANLSCLVQKDKIKELSDELDKINSSEVFSVRFTGPWPPYSFVSKKEVK